MYYAWPALDAAYNATRQFMFGDNVLSAPISTVEWAGNGGSPTNETSRGVWLPPGAWAAWDGYAVFAGPTTVAVHCAFNATPLFVRGGALLPLATRDAAGDSSGTASPPLAWVLFPGGSSGAPAEAHVWEDDGVSTADAAGSATTAARATIMGAVTTLAIDATIGTYRGLPAARAHELQVRGWLAGRPRSVTVDGRALQERAYDAPVGTPGFFIVPAAAHSLVAPVGSLRVVAGVLSSAAAHKVVVTANAAA